MNVPVHLVVALPAEAKPLVKYFRLQKENIARGFDVYRRDNLALVVSGVGKTQAAAAVAWLQAVNGNPKHAVWINCGIAGRSGMQPGDILLAHKVQDAATGEAWYPVRIERIPVASDCLHTVDQASDLYPADAAVDMEASGFYATALRFSEAELVHCLKVVSDNEAEGQKAINRQSVSQWMEGLITSLELLLESLQPLAYELQELDAKPENYQDYLDKWHFTASQKLQLQDLLRRWQVLAPQQESGISIWGEVKNSRALLAELKSRVDALPVHFGSLSEAGGEE